MIDYKNSVYKAGAVLIATLNEYTGHNFVYADQEIQIPRPVGLINKAFEEPSGHSFLEYDDLGKETAVQFYEVTFEVFFITDKKSTDVAESMFLPSSVLNAIRTSWKATSFRAIWRAKCKELDVDVSILKMGQVREALKEEGSQTYVPASLDLVVHLKSEFTREQANVPCLEEGQLPIGVELDLKN